MARLLAVGQRHYCKFDLANTAIVVPTALPAVQWRNNYGERKNSLGTLKSWPTATKTTRRWCNTWIQSL